MDKLRAIFELRSILHQMEQDVGLRHLNQSEWNVFLVARSLTEKPGGAVDSNEIRKHPMVAPIAQATYHRTLRALLDMGLLQRANGSKAKSYLVRPDLIVE
ncbi:MAG: hypothetical protein HKP40_04860 [Litoreibacter sp.]|nr:hypothetical protein [Litoreibacter sp.]